MTPNQDANPLDENPRLLGIAKALCDGVPVDWEDMEDDGPEVRRIKSRLRFLQTVAEAHRRVLEGEAGRDPSGRGD